MFSSHISHNKNGNSSNSYSNKSINSHSYNSSSNNSNIPRQPQAQADQQLHSNISTNGTGRCPKSYPADSLPRLTKGRELPIFKPKHNKLSKTTTITLYGK